MNATDLLWLLLPLAAASGWFVARLEQKRRARQTFDLPSAYFKGLNFLLNEQPDKAIEVFIRVLEVNSETDFVSKNDKFRGFVDAISNIIIEKNPADLDVLKALPFDAEYNVEQALSQLIATIGENMNIRRFVRVEGDVVASYVHGLGKIGVLVTINGQQSDALDEVSRGIAMHVAAVNPLFVTREDVSADVVEREKAVLSERAQASGKPAEIVEKIVLGQLSKFYAENCLLEQDFVVDSDVKVSKALANAQAGATIQSVSRFQLGEGIEKKEEDFAAEVAAQVKGG